MASDERYPIDKYPYYEIHDWDEHQSEHTDRYIRVKTDCLVTPKYTDLSAAVRGVLLGLWLYRGRTGSAPRRDAQWVRSALRLHHDRYVSAHLKTLERRGFLKPCRYSLKKRGEKRREDYTGTRSRPVKPSASPPIATLTAGQVTVKIDQAKIDQWRANYSTVTDPVAELKRCQQWLNDNPGRRPRDQRTLMGAASRWIGRRDRWNRERSQGVPLSATPTDREPTEDELAAEVQRYNRERQKRLQTDLR